MEIPGFLGSPRSFTHCGASRSREWATRGSAISRRCGSLPKRQRLPVPSRSGSIRCMRCLASDPDRASPYHPSDRRFLDPLAIDAFALPAPLLTAEVRGRDRAGVVRSLASFGKAVRRLCRGRRAQKSDLRCCPCGVPRSCCEGAPPIRSSRISGRFRAAGGETLRRFAIFSAIEASFQVTRDQFPEPLKSPLGSGIAAFAAAHEDAISRAKFLQWLADRQFAAAARGCEASSSDFIAISRSAALPMARRRGRRPEVLMPGRIDRCAAGLARPEWSGVESSALRSARARKGRLCRFRPS